MDSRGYIPGLWEEEINVADFLNLNRKPWNSKLSKIVHELFFDEDYDVLKDENKIFSYLVPFQREHLILYNENQTLYLNEETFANFTETSEKKKLLDMGLILRAREAERWAFIQPDICIIPLYGTKVLTKTLKQYIKDLDKQFQTQEWTHRKINHHRSVTAIQNFEEFALKHGINVKKPCDNAKDVANVLWITSLFTCLENPNIPFTFYSIFELLDIFIEKDIKQKKIKEREAQLLVDELYCKLAALQKSSLCLEMFDFSVTLNSSKINNTTIRLIESALEYKSLKIPFQLILNTEQFPVEIVKKLEELFLSNHPIAVSQSLRKKGTENLSLTSEHTFFKNFEDITMHFASFDLGKAFIIALNGGKDVVTNGKIQQVTKALNSANLSFEDAFTQFELFLKYYITLYTEYNNSYAYYYDMFHNLPFRNSLITSYPYYLINLAYHNVSTIVNLLTAIYKNQYTVKTNSKGYIEEIIPLTDGQEEFISSKLNEIIHNETKRMLFYKNGHYNIVFFSESPFFQKEDTFVMPPLSKSTYLETSFSGFQLIEREEFKQFLYNFTNSNYSHIRVCKK